MTDRAYPIDSRDVTGVEEPLFGGGLDSWDDDDRVAVAELAAGEGVRFANPDDAVAWLTDDDDEERAR